MSLSHQSSVHLHLRDLIDFSQDQERGYKPRGLWLSDDSKYGWMDWQADSGYRYSESLSPIRHVVWLKPDANILWIRDGHQLQTFGRQWRDYGGYLLWPDIAKKYDGIMITPYQWPMRMSIVDSWYYSWDCASGCIWNPRAIAGMRRAKTLKRHLEVTYE